MSRYVKVTDGKAEFYTIGQLRRDNSDTGFPVSPSDELLAEWGLYPVIDAPRPEYDPATQDVTEGSIEFVDGRWMTTWHVRDLTREELFDRLPFKTPEEARREMVRWIDSISAQVLDMYPRAVQARWMIEEAAARAVLGGTDTDAQLELIAREGAAKGRTPGEHAQAVVKNADLFRAITDQINTLFLATDTALQQANHPSQYVQILARAKEQAAPLAEAYGLKT